MYLPMIGCSLSASIASGRCRAAFFPGLGILYKTDGNGVLVGVHEKTTKDALVCRAHTKESDTLVAVGVEAVVDDVFFETDDGFHADCDVFETDWIDNASAFCNEGVNTFCVDDEIAFEGFFANGNTAYAAHLCG